MKKGLTVFLITLCLAFTSPLICSSAVEWEVHQTLKVEKTPVDVAMSITGKWIFVLTDEGEILIYSPDGTLKERISVGKSIDGIKAGPREDILLLSSRKDATVQLITVDFIHELDLTGSPFKGPADAPVVIAVFTDFQ